MEIPIKIFELHKLFKASGKKLYLVGGCVRDYIIGDKPKDFDLVTDALPDEIVNIIGNSYTIDIRGKAFGVVVVDDFEIATFRSDISTGRNPIVKVGVDITSDSKRRDLTYNALYFDLDTNEVIDLTNGINDLNNKVSKMIGDPNDRFNEDALRKLRLLRFAIRYEHSIDELTYNSLKENSKLESPNEFGDIIRVSQERVWNEFVNTFNRAKDFNRYLSILNDLNMFGEVFIGSNIKYSHIDSDRLDVILAKLFENESNLVNKMIYDWKIESNLVNRVMFLINLNNFKPENILLTYKKYISVGLSKESFLDYIKINNLDLINFLDFKPSVKAIDLINFKGKELGDEINRLEFLNYMKKSGF